MGNVITNEEVDAPPNPPHSSSGAEIDVHPHSSHSPRSTVLLAVALPDDVLGRIPAFVLRIEGPDMSESRAEAGTGIVGLGVGCCPASCWYNSPRGTTRADRWRRRSGTRLGRSTPRRRSHWQERRWGGGGRI
jgi:hypothetical protein